MHSDKVERLIRFLCRGTGSNAGSGRLRVGLLVESGRPEVWLDEFAWQIAQIPFLELKVFTIPVTPTSAHPLMRKYRELDRAPDSLDLQPGSVSLSVNGTELTPESCDSIRAAHLDVLLAPALGRLCGSCEGLARYGVWSFEIEGAPLGAGNFGLFRSYERNASDFSIGLVKHETNLRNAVRLQTICPRFQFEFYDQWRPEALRSLAVAVCVELLRIRLNWPNTVRWGVALREPYSRPGVVRTTGVFNAKVVRYMQARFRRQGAPREWFILWRKGDGHTLPHQQPTDWQEFTGFPDHQAADPFAFTREGKNYLFYEDVVPPKGHGRLAVAPFENGCPGKPEVILEKDYHLSYPYVFEFKGQTWMIPESGEHCTVDLYRAENFPLRWTYAATLADDVAFVDTTPVYVGNRWFFFTTSALPGGVLASFLFTAETLESPWTLHPCNPVSLSADNSRGAGRILDRDGALIRPVQDCTLDYGYAIAFNQIAELTPERFYEKQIARILFTRQSSIVATHTFNAEGGIEVTDGRRYIR